MNKTYILGLAVIWFISWGISVFVVKTMKIPKELNSVYILRIHYGYGESQDIIGIYKTKEAAEKVGENIKIEAGLPYIDINQYELLD